ncbi:MAG: putative transposase [Acidimicrobiaceae bacterium]|jgi:transposase-like protein
MIRSWENAWVEFVLFLAFPVEFRKVVYTTNAIESLNARFRRAVQHRGHFPNEQSALKVLYLVVTRRQKNRERRDRGNQFAAALLMPRRLIESTFESHVVTHSHDRIVALLARRFEVSEQAMRFRLMNLALVDPI